MNAKHHAKMKARIEDHLRELGATPVASGPYDWVVPTLLGRLGVTIVPHHRGQRLVSILCHFEDKDVAARRFHGLSPYNGKWNHYYGDGYNVDGICDHFFAQLAKTRDEQAKLEAELFALQSGKETTT